VNNTRRRPTSSFVSKCNWQYWKKFSAYALYNRIRKSSTTFRFAQVVSCSNEDGTKGIRYEALIDY